MTTLGENDGRDSETMGEWSAALDAQNVATDVQTETTTVEEMMEAPMVASGDCLETVDPLALVTTPEEVMMVVGVDPAMCTLSTFVSADEAVLSESSGTPLKSVLATPLTPLRDFLSAAESTPGAFGQEHASGLRDTSADMEMDVGTRSRRVVGRKLAVVEDDVETQSSMSVTSVDEGLTTASSSKAKNKGVKRSRRTEGKEESNGERKREKKGKKRQAVRKDTPEELSDGKCGEPKGVVDLVFEDMSSSVLGGAIVEWANRIDEIRAKSKNLQGRLNGEMKKCVSKIKEGTALLVARSEATGDPQFLRMRNTEWATRLREMENENARLKEQLRKMSLGPSPPRRKRKVDRVASGTDSP